MVNFLNETINSLYDHMNDLEESLTEEEYQALSRLYDVCQKYQDKFDIFFPNHKESV